MDAQNIRVTFVYFTYGSGPATGWTTRIQHDFTDIAAIEAEAPALISNNLGYLSIQDFMNKYFQINIQLSFYGPVTIPEFAAVSPGNVLPTVDKAMYLWYTHNPSEAVNVWQQSDLIFGIIDTVANDTYGDSLFGNAFCYMGVELVDFNTPTNDINAIFRINEIATIAHELLHQLKIPDDYFLPHPPGWNQYCIMGGYTELNKYTVIDSYCLPFAQNYVRSPTSRVFGFSPFPDSYVNGIRIFNDEAQTLTVSDAAVKLDVYFNVNPVVVNSVVAHIDDTDVYLLQSTVEHWETTVSLNGYGSHVLTIRAKSFDTDIIVNAITLQYSPPPPPSYSNVTISVAGQGNTDPAVGNYPAQYEVGKNLTVAANPALGWQYVKMRRNGVDETTANPAEFLNLQAIESVEVVFEQTIEPRFPIILLVPIAGIVTIGLIWWAVQK